MVRGSRTKRGRDRQSRSRGQALVEFAIIFPVFMLILSGILDFGFLLYSRMTIINAAREGARAAIQVSDATTIPTVVHGQVMANASGLNTGLITTTTSCVAIVSTPTCSWASTTTSSPGDAVSVSVAYSYKSFFPLLFGNTIPLGTTVQMVIE
jgi:Flp pilus assembly protein TadG